MEEEEEKDEEGKEEQGEVEVQETKKVYRDVRNRVDATRILTADDFKLLGG